MIGIDFPFDNVVALTTEGALTEEDFDSVARAIDGPEWSRSTSFFIISGFSSRKLRARSFP